MTTTNYIGVASTDASDNSAWDNNAPDASVDAVIATSTECDINSTVEAHSIDFTGYTGTLDSTGGNGLSAHGGNITLVPGMTIDNGADPNNDIYARFYGSGSLTFAGKTLYAFGGYVDGTAITLVDNGTIHSFGTDNGFTWTINQGTTALHWIGLNEDGASFGENPNTPGKNQTWSWSTGASLLLDNAVDELVYVGFHPDAPQWPPTTMDADGTWQFYENIPHTAVATWSVKSFTLTSGDLVLYTDGTYKALEIVVEDDVAFNGGSVAHNGWTWTISGNFVSNGVDLDGMTAEVAGTNVAHDCTITDCDFSGGTELDATDGCTDGGGNTNVNFGAAPVTTTPVVTGACMF